MFEVYAAKEFQLKVGQSPFLFKSYFGQRIALAFMFA